MLVRNRTLKREYRLPSFQTITCRQQHTDAGELTHRSGDPEDDLGHNQVGNDADQANTQIGHRQVAQEQVGARAQCGTSGHHGQNEAVSCDGRTHTHYIHIYKKEEETSRLSPEAELIMLVNGDNEDCSQLVILA